MFPILSLVIIFLSTLIIILILASILELPLKKVTIYEYEKGLRYKNGSFDKVLESGRYNCNDFQIGNTPNINFMKKKSDKILIKKLDIRPTNISINGQEVITSDCISLKLSLVARYEIVDIYKTLNKVQNYYEVLYSDIQTSARDIIGNSKIDELLENRNILNEKLNDQIIPKAEEFGIKIHFVSIKDIIFPGELKQVFAQVIKAKKEGLAMLEKARGETASLRNLANASKMLDDNPSLIYLRMIQALDQSKGNTLVLGANPEDFFSKK
ncbi:MAG: slipin family protein [Candidatus Sericytochromatia bacterium]